MGTKTEPGAYDCYAKAELNEPMFTLLARDPWAPMLVELWVQLRTTAASLAGVDEDSDEKYQEALRLAREMRAWQENRAAMFALGEELVTEGAPEEGGAELFGMTLEQMTAYIDRLSMDEQRQFNALATKLHTALVLAGARFDPDKMTSDDQSLIKHTFIQDDVDVKYGCKQCGNQVTHELHQV